jgi:Zn-dependent protease
MIAVLPAMTPLAAGELDVLGLVLSLVLLVLCLSAHEAAHAFAAWKCGDSTGKDMGRMTLNPLPHIDPVMTIILPGAMFLLSNGQFLFGGAKPVPVNFHRLRSPWRDMSLVAIAGPLSNLLLAGFFLAAWHFFVDTGMYNGAAESAYLRRHDLLPVVLYSAVSFNLLLTVFNLIPIPPLDGSRVMAWMLPAQLRSTYLSIESIGIMLIFGLYALVPGFRIMLMSTADALLTALNQIVTLGGLW